NPSSPAAVPNFDIVAIGADGYVDFYNYAGSTDLLGDIAGYFVRGSTYSPLTPVRLFDTRHGTGGVTQAPIGPNSTLKVKVAGVDGVPANATAVALNITAVDATEGTYITAWPDGATQPKASNLNPSSPAAVPNFDIVAIGADGYVDFYNYAGSTDLLADIAGYYTAGSTYTPLTPVRLFDTRHGTGGVTQAPIGPNSTLKVKVAGVDGVPSDATAVALNITAVNATEGTYITAWPDGATQPKASNLNPDSPAAVPNFDIVAIGTDGYVDFYNYAGSTDLLADIAGYSAPS
ncbi:MAG: hypothetical protein ACRDYY_12635, partial [Acidimicrobiales bacterium]